MQPPGHDRATTDGCRPLRRSSRTERFVPDQQIARHGSIAHVQSAFRQEPPEEHRRVRGSLQDLNIPFRSRGHGDNREHLPAPPAERIESRQHSLVDNESLLAANLDRPPLVVRQRRARKADRPRRDRSSMPSIVANQCEAPDTQSLGRDAEVTSVRSVRSSRMESAKRRVCQQVEQLAIGSPWLAPNAESTRRRTAIVPSSRGSTSCRTQFRSNAVVALLSSSTGLMPDCAVT